MCEILLVICDSSVSLVGLLLLSGVRDGSV